ncbi:helix-turn-helix domain-containing protein [Aureibacter tunicatorum]|uniref:Transcriptional regulator with XRE-family HTH domain n=1 Tax=Aureibacter tunicatorum TaxID=866807 RepID=A0AAE3XLV2_9BACT|nr:helix-turn-helix domain-containing protein [Aureibacter tunicatorum]MDR6239297.1 transcriptional regulator with XRE-family HTH domain [Aureibacter tunicatorum]BDD04778.1 hypothetical protein AUTU_22610 [Aureibacter tunicatorum]
MTLISRNIKFFRKRLNITQAKFAELIGVKRSLVGAYEEGRSDPRLVNLLTISRLFKVSVDHLITLEFAKLSEKKIKDIQTIFEAKNKVTKPAKTDTKILTITVDNEENENIELVPHKASAGYTSGYADPDYIQDLPKFQLPMLPNDGTYRAFEISGDSMLPLQSGTVIISKYIENISSVKNGQTYVLVTKDEGVVYKRVFNYLDENSKFFLVSDNESYEPYEVFGDDVLEVWEAKAFISVAFPEGNNYYQNNTQANNTSTTAQKEAPTITLEDLTKIVIELKDEVTKLKRS